MLHEVIPNHRHDMRRDVDVTSARVGLRVSDFKLAFDMHDAPPDADNARVDVDITAAQLG